MTTAAAGRTTSLRSIPEIAARLWAELGAVRTRFLQTVFAGLLAHCGIAVATVGTAAILGNAIVGTVPTAGLMVTVGIAAVVAAVATWWEMYASHDLAYLVMAGMRVRLYRRLRHTVPSRHDPRHSGDLAARALSDVEAMEWVFAHVFGQVLTALVMLAGAGTALALVDPALCWVLAASSVLVLSVPWWRRRRTDRRADLHRTSAAKLSADIVDTVQGMAVLASAGALPRRLVQHHAASRRLDRMMVRDAVRSGLELAATELCVTGAGIAGLLLVTDAVRGGAVAGERVPVILALFGLALAPLAAVAGALRNLGTTRSAGSRLAEVLDAPDTLAPATGPFPPLPTAATEVLSMHQVRFGYQPDQPVLQGVDLAVRSGEIVGLAGPSGVGKSTVAALSQRFFDPDAGSVRISGVDLREMSDAQLRTRLAVVAQRVDLFAATLRENLTLGLPEDHPGRTERRLREAAAVARLDEVIERLPGGWDEPLREHGSSLSGGERVRVALARALLRDPDLLILDEAVAGFDSVLEQQILAALRELDPLPAVLMIAHRPSTLAACDRVITLVDGRAGSDTGNAAPDPASALSPTGGR